MRDLEIGRSAIPMCFSLKKQQVRAVLNWTRRTMSDHQPKTGPYYPMYGDDFDQGCRSAGLDPAQTGAYIVGMNLQWRVGGPFTRKQFQTSTPWHPRTSSRLLDELVKRGKFAETDGRFSNARTASEIAKFRGRSASASSREQRKNRGSNPRSKPNLDGEWKPSKKPKLSEKPNDNNKAPRTEAALLRTQNLESPPVVPQAGDDGVDEIEIRVQFAALWDAYPDCEWKDHRADCLAEVRRIISGANHHGKITLPELVASVRRYAQVCASRERKFGRVLIMAPKRFLADGRWLDYPEPKRRADHDPGSSTVPMWDDANRLERMDTEGPYTVEQRTVALCGKARGWHDDLGPTPTSGERSALHDHIARTPGLLRRLEREFRIEWPSALQDIADLADASGTSPPRLHLAAVDGRAIA